MVTAAAPVRPATGPGGAVSSEPRHNPGYHPVDYRRWLPLSLAIAALSLPVLPHGLGYDPWSWMIWGREQDHGSLLTAGAASAFKPLPAFTDALLALSGHAAGDLWLVCARAGVVISAVLIYHLATQLSGRTAAVVATLGWLTAKQLAGYLALEGMSEPICAACALFAIDAHLCRHRLLAVVLGGVGSLVRIELLPFVACYAAVSFVIGARRPKAGTAAAAVLVAVTAAWFLPDAISSGDVFRSVARAAQESQGGPLLSSHPGLSTLAESAGMVFWPLAAIFAADTAVTAFAWARHRRRRPTFWLTLGAWAWLGVEAVMADMRVAAGAPRFLLPGLALAVIVAGCAWAGLMERLQSRATRRGTLVVALASMALLAGAAPGVVQWARQERTDWRSGVNVQRLAAELPRAVSDLGGRRAAVTCGTIAAAPLQNPAVAWALDVPLGDVGILPSRRGVVFATDGQPPVRARGYKPVGTVGPLSARWALLTTCDLGSADVAVNDVAVKRALLTGPVSAGRAGPRHKSRTTPTTAGPAPE